MKKNGANGIFLGVIAICLLAIIGWFVDRGDAKEYEEEIVHYVEIGDYTSAIWACEAEDTMKGLSKKVRKLMIDVYAYDTIRMELQKSSPDFEGIDDVFDEMTGQYKKYKKFKEDVKELKKQVKQAKKEKK